MKHLFPLLLGLSLLGCQPAKEAGPVRASGKFVAAKLDTLPILQNDPEYKALSEKYVLDQLNLRKKLETQVSKGQITKEQAGQQYLKEQNALNQKWMKSTDNFIQSRHGNMREVVKKLCEEKGIDIVLIDSKAYRSVAYGALDITQDVLIQIYGSKNTPVPGGTPK